MPAESNLAPVEGVVVVESIELGDRGEVCAPQDRSYPGRCGKGGKWGAVESSIFGKTDEVFLSGETETETFGHAGGGKLVEVIERSIGEPPA